MEFWNNHVERRARSQNIATKNAFQLRDLNPYAALIGENEMFLTCASKDGAIGSAIEKEKSLLFRKV